MTGRRIRVRGLVQGVGFRPYVWSLANSLGLSGWVRNDGGGVTIGVRGSAIDTFEYRLSREIPPLARIDAIESVPDNIEGEGFSILASVADTLLTAIGPDAAICSACVADLCNPEDRRWRYAFTTCTHCGPRYTVTRRLPYDRPQTSLAGFPLCPDCEREYRKVTDRRFHAQTTCCPACGPRLQLCHASGAAIDGDPIAQTLDRLRSGAIVAIKGLGGFHLVCNARNAQAVAHLRLRKQREAKPLAVMALNAASLATNAQIDAAALALLKSPAAPIVLCRKGAQELPGIAPGVGSLGVMFPATPLQLLLWHEAAGRPSGSAWLDETAELLLVMSSANPHGEPLVFDNAEAFVRLADIADALLLHDRDIAVRCDDSVLLPGPVFVRRARGYTPVPIALVDDGSTVLALGGSLKNTVCVARGREAFLSQHIGGLDNAPALGFLEEVVAHLLSILQVRPACIAHDLHPDFASTHLALALAAQWNVPAHAVPHHHAHIGAVCAEHGLRGPVLGLAIDGVGLGSDGGLWGGELLRVDGAQCRRLGHLAPLALPGGDRAAREPWRMAVAALHGLGRAHEVKGWLHSRYPDLDADPLLQMLERKLHCPMTSSMGRMFDAAAGLLGVRSHCHFEGQAAMELEGLAQRHGPVTVPDGAWLQQATTLDFSPLLARLAHCNDPGYGASLFHAAVANALAHWLRAEAARHALSTLVVAGGCAINAVLMAALRDHLAGSGLALFEARQAPANDGGLALGQAWVARQQP
ncbi:MAG: carbamoyltransferase HypF [Rhodoferax sp.]|nr:carbamoyltransferase HypF [Rhodoferax sp.]